MKEIHYSNAPTQREKSTWEGLPEILKVSEVAEFLRLPKRAIYEAIRLGILPAVNAGTRRTRISKRALGKVFNAVVEGARTTAAFGHVPEAQ